MDRLDRKRYDLGELARRLADVRISVDPVSFNGLLLPDVLSVLATAVKFHSDIPDADRAGLVWSAAGDAAKSSEITADSLSTALKAAEHDYMRRPVAEYVLATSLTIDPRHVPVRMNRDGHSLLFARKHPKAIQRARESVDLATYTAIANPELLVSVRTVVHARTPAAAFDIGIERLDYLRSLWNFQVNRRTISRSSSGIPQSINSIRLGPVHSLHLPAGALANHSFWYELPGHQTNALADLRGGVQKLTKVEMILRGRIRRLRYGPALREQLVNYARALDYADYDAAFNRLWAVLEHLSGCVGRYGQIADRVSFLYDPAELNYIRQLVEHLRDVRNGLVHESRARTGMETYLWQLKGFVEALLGFHLSRTNPFASFDVAGQYLDLPPDPAILRSQLKTLRRAHIFRSPRPAV
jgi:hypothetical protein